MRTTLDFDDELIKAAKIEAVRRGMTLTALLAEYTRTCLAAGLARPRVSFPTAPGRLDLPAGVDPNHTSAILDYLDALDADS